MSYSAAEPVVSGVPYPVTEVAGAPATGLDDFVGPVEVLIDKSGTPYLINGEGHLGDDGVRLHEKSGPGGKDLRVWRVFRGTGQEILAETV